MTTIKKILFPTDFSRCADQALRHAVYLARQYRAEIHLLHVMVLHDYDPHNPKRTFPEANELLKRLKEYSHNEMSAAIVGHDLSDITLKRVQLRDISAAPAIVQYAHEEDVDLIVMGTHGRRGLKHLLLGSVAEEVVRTAYRPVFTIREKEEPKDLDAIEGILVPIDFSKYSREALIYAKEFAARYKAQLSLLHVVEETRHPAFYNTGVTSVFDMVPDLKEKALQAMQRMLDESPGPTVKADLQVIRGRAARDIVNFAEQNDVDLIVIATHGLTGLEHLLMGSVTEKVVRMAPCPVFTVKPFGKSLVKTHDPMPSASANLT